MSDMSDILIKAYRQGIFPMADDAASDDIHFYRPVLRALLPLRPVRIPKRLLKTVKSSPYRVTVNTAFDTVIRTCAQRHERRDRTWINPVIEHMFMDLHRQGMAHSVECWTTDGDFAGGLYGLAIGGVFCGESMVSRARDASKIALVHLCARLVRGGFTLLDTQFANPHLTQFGLYEMPQAEYEVLIKTEMNKTADFVQAGITEETICQDYLATFYSGGAQEPKA